MQAINNGSNMQVLSLFTEHSRHPVTLARSSFTSARFPVEALFCSELPSVLFLVEFGPKTHDSFRPRLSPLLISPATDRFPIEAGDEPLSRTRRCSCRAFDIWNSPRTAERSCLRTSCTTKAARTDMPARGAPGFQVSRLNANVDVSTRFCAGE